MDISNLLAKNTESDVLAIKVVIDLYIILFLSGFSPVRSRRMGSPLFALEE